MTTRTLRKAVRAAATALAVLLASAARRSRRRRPGWSPPATSPATPDPAWNGGAGTAAACRMRATSDLVLALAPDAVLLLGDNQYEKGAHRRRGPRQRRRALQRRAPLGPDRLPHPAPLLAARHPHGGRMAVRADLAATGTVHLVVDVVGYFR